MLSEFNPSNTTNPAYLRGKKVCYTTRETCRVCGTRDLTFLFSIGSQYVSDFVKREKIYSGFKCPIHLELCNSCKLVQLKHTAPQEILYSRHYWYRSGVTDTMKLALRDVTRAAERVGNLKDGDTVLDIGSNDGTLLRSYCTEGLVKIGVEPALNLVEDGSRGVDLFINDFWDYNTYNNATSYQPKVITAIGMFYDLEDPNKFISDVAKTLAPDGVFIAQLMCLKNMIGLRDVSNLAHEHLEFYSIRSLERLFGIHGLEIFDIETNNVNGESYRIYARHRAKVIQNIPESVQKAKNIEIGLDDPSFYKKYFKDLQDNRLKVRKFIGDVVCNGKIVWVYGASTKGNVLLQYYGLNSTFISGAADRSPEKWDKYTIGTGIKIYSEKEAREANPDYFLVLPYAFLDEFVEREKKWRDGGGKFIVPLPEFRIV